jgi:hypothetical protein
VRKGSGIETPSPAEEVVSSGNGVRIDMYCAAAFKCHKVKEIIIFLEKSHSFLTRRL